MKTKEDRKFNKIIRDINKLVAADVYKDRFYITQLKKRRNIYGGNSILLELKDKLQPERDVVLGWYTYNRFVKVNLLTEMNDFILYSNFWSIYKET